jgi:hypothetical protein
LRRCVAQMVSLSDRLAHPETWMRDLEALDRLSRPLPRLQGLQCFKPYKARNSLPLLLSCLPITGSDSVSLLPLLALVRCHSSGVADNTRAPLCCRTGAEQPTLQEPSGCSQRWPSSPPMSSSCWRSGLSWHRAPTERWTASCLRTHSTGMTLPTPSRPSGAS